MAQFDIAGGQTIQFVKTALPPAPRVKVPSGMLTNVEPIQTVSAFGLTADCKSLCDSISNVFLRGACKVACGVIPGDDDLPGDQFMPDCGPGFTRDPNTGNCIIAFGTDPTPGVTTPAERSVGVGGLALPMLVGIPTHICPTFADGKKGILWMNALTGEVICLPRGTNGTGFGLIRKNKPRKKAFISAADIKVLRRKDAIAKKTKALAKLSGMTCAPRGRGRG